MKKQLLLIISIIVIKTGFSQVDTVAMKPFADSVCNCLSKKDLSKINSKGEANAAISDCFTQYAVSMIELAQKQKINIEDDQAMHDFGVELGKELFRVKCQPFVQISMKLADDNNVNEAGSMNGSTSGKLKKIDNKDFRYFLLTDANNREHSFIWLHYFTGSEAFIDNAEKWIGKPIKIKWKETEVFLPQSKGYYKIKEIIGIDVMQ